MIVVGLAAVAITSLLYANIFWASLWITSCFLILLAALLGIGYAQFERRAFFVGFSILGWGYFLARWNVIGSFTAEYFATTIVLELLSELREPSSATGLFGIDTSREMVNHIGQSLFNLAIATGGGMLGRFAYRRREKASMPHSTTLPPPLP